MYLVSFFNAVGVTVPVYLFDDGIADVRGVTFDFNPLALVTGLGIGLIAMFGGRAGSLVNVGVCCVTVAIVFFCIIAGAFYADTANWHVFAPYGGDGVFKGAALVFFAFVGFDAVACSAEEAANPKADVPFGMIASLATVTALYVAVSAVLTLMVNYANVNTDAPLSFAFVVHGANWAQIIVSLGSLSALFTTVLTAYVAQSRIFFAMARDGLLPKFLARVVGRRQVPLAAVAVVVVFGSFMGALIELESLAEMVSIGTLVALTFVCASVLMLRYDVGGSNRNVSIIVGTMLVLFILGSALFRFQQRILAGVAFALGLFAMMPLYWMPKSPQQLAFKTPFVPLFPTLGLAFNLFMMASLSDATWIRLIVWSAIGMVIYFGYSRRHSKIGRQGNDQVNMVALDNNDAGARSDAAQLDAEANQVGLDESTTDEDVQDAEAKADEVATIPVAEAR